MYFAFDCHPCVTNSQGELIDRSNVNVFHVALNKFAAEQSSAHSCSSAKSNACSEMPKQQIAAVKRLMHAIDFHA